MVSLVLLAVLRAEQVTARYRIRSGGWVRAAKWFTLGATYVMNTWSAYTSGSAALVVLHSVPPLVVFVAAEAVTDLRDKLTEAFTAAAVNDVDRASTSSEPVVKKPPAARASDSRRRKSAAEYRAEARAAWQPGTEVTPAWVREVTSCSRGLSSRIASELVAELDQTVSARAGESEVQR
jgi:hypothetical protein